VLEAHFLEGDFGAALQACMQPVIIDHAVSQFICKSHTSGGRIGGVFLHVRQAPCSCSRHMYSSQRASILCGLQVTSSGRVLPAISSRNDLPPVRVVDQFVTLISNRRQTNIK